MPFRAPSNNRILPANARASDVAERAVQEIIPVQQRRYYDAFRVQGIECVHYNHMTQGRKCLCQSSQKQLKGILDETGKADVGTLNKMLTGNMNFNVTAYNQNEERVVPGMTDNNWTSPFAPGNKNQGVFDIKTLDGDFPFADQVDGPDFGDNGPVETIDIDELVGDFDASHMGFSDVACPICFGTGFVGGFSPYHAHRQVFTIADLQLNTDSEIDTLARPWTAEVESGFNVVAVLPRGAIGIDAFRVWNMSTPVQGVAFTIDGTPVTSNTTLLTFCDGKRHVIGAQFQGRFSHFELQFNLTNESIYFEFPRRPSSSDTALLEQMEPFQIIVSPNCPIIGEMDVIVESQLGKVLVVQNANPWNSRQRNVLGWEVQVRVIQPMEMFRILPYRARIPNKDRTTQMVRDNVTGRFRT